MRKSNTVFVLFAVLLICLGLTLVEQHASDPTWIVIYLGCLLVAVFLLLLVSVRHARANAQRKEHKK